MAAPKPCPSCAHRHTQSRACPECECIGTAEWFDWVVLHRCMAGKAHLVGRALTQAEKRVGVRDLHARGKLPSEIAEILGISRSAVAHHYLEELRRDVA